MGLLVFVWGGGGGVRPVLVSETGEEEGQPLPLDDPPPRGVLHKIPDSGNQILFRKKIRINFCKGKRFLGHFLVHKLPDL